MTAQEDDSTSVTHKGDALGWADEIAWTLIEEMETGALAAGSRINEAALAKRFDVDRAVVRSAIRYLEAKSLVVRNPNKGAYVAHLDADATLEALRIRGVLWAHLVERAAKLARPGERRSIQASVTTIMKAAEAKDMNAVAFTEVCRRVYKLLGEVARSPRLRDLIVELSAGITYHYAHLASATAELRKKRADELQRVAEAILAGDPEQARQVAETGYESSIRDALEIYELQRNRR